MFADADSALRRRLIRNGKGERAGIRNIRGERDGKCIAAVERQFDGHVFIETAGI